MIGQSTVAVVIPAYDSGKTIVEALSSVFGQTLWPSEIVVVDDCSRDDTCEVVEAWREANLGIHGRHRRGEGFSLSLVGLSENGGPARARNAGIREAKGAWVAFLDADDAWLPDKLATQMRVVEEHPDAVMVCGLTVRLTTDGTAQPGGQLADASEAAKRQRTEGEKDTRSDAGVEVREISLEEFVDVNPVSTSTVLVKKSVLEQVGGFDEQFRGPEDLDLWMRIAEAGKLLQVKRPVSRYREVGGSLSNEVSSFLPQVISVYEKAFAEGGALCEHAEWQKRAIGSRYVSACWRELACGRRLSALKFLAKSVVLWPWRLHGKKRKPFWRWILLAKIILNKA